MRLAVVVVLGLASGIARADDAARIDEARQQVEAADIDFKLARFPEALAGYTRAYEIYPTPPLLFNIGQCHRNLKNYEKAAFFYKSYLRDAPKASNRAVVEDLLREVTAELDKQRVAAADEARRQRELAEAQRREDEARKRRVDEPGALARVAPWAMIGGGAALVGLGGVFYYYGAKRGPDEMFVYDDTRAVGGTLMVIGVASAAVGGVMVWRRARAHSSPMTAITSQRVVVGWTATW